jgi:hypothetical protein
LANRGRDPLAISCAGEAVVEVGELEEEGEMKRDDE